jgi:hypothetical protein
MSQHKGQLEKLKKTIREPRADDRASQSVIMSRKAEQIANDIQKLAGRKQEKAK